MNDNIKDLALRYSAALRNYLETSGEPSLHEAYELGRTALNEGIGVVDMTLLHYEAVSDLLRTHRDSLRLMAPTAIFLIESLSPFEMMLRGYRETNTRLNASVSDLTRSNKALAAIHETLKTEVMEREHIETSLIHAQKMQAVGLLVGGVAHHFNNLLMVILGNLQLVTHNYQKGKDIGRYLVAAMTGAERGAEIVKHLMTFSRQQILQTEIIDVTKWLATVTPLLSSSVRDDIHINVNIIEQVWPIKIDPAQLELALLSIAMNAQDAMPNGGSLQLSVTNQHLDNKLLELNGDYVVIDVTDTGAGIAPENIQHAFEPFFTTKGPARSGLGLAQVYGFVNQSGGIVNLESIVGQGTTVHIYMPADMSDKASDEVKTSSESIAQQPNTSVRVLLVDDNVEIADLAGQLLENCGYTVKRVHSGREALDLLDAGEPVDLVFSDILMSEMNGMQLAEEIRQRFPSLSVLLTTGYNDAILQAVAHGFPTITKPYTAQTLCDRISELMSKPKPTYPAL
jgi:signal transduction histidine kinase/CheY-like chemotaxis protein